MPYNFNTIADNYDRLNHIMTLGMDRCWRRRAVQGLQGKVLDVACGTGDMSVLLAKQGCTVTGIDISDEMLNIAQRKSSAGVATSASGTPAYQVADAEHLPFDDATFDIITCAFGIRNFVHFEQGLSEMARVLEPGGRMVILELSTPDNPIIRPFYNFYARHVIPWMGARIAGNREAYTYLPASIEHFPKGKVMLRILENVGLKAKQKKLFFGVCRMYRCVKRKSNS